LALLSFIAEVKKDNVIFAMEEPEIALPPHTQRRIAKYLLEETADSTPSGHPVRSHLARHSTATWPPVPRPSGRAVGAQRRRGC
ncbi:hypothetical protein GNQ40_34705, partial [Pseudomonas aeruginosa]|nr:hypothetical protein [Pseudomonas aeruginosa]MUI40033.1 hypothetical protein [Pseudomonas aeruginosa]